MLHVILVTKIFSVSVTDTELALLSVTHLVLHRDIIVAAGSIELSVVVGGVVAVQDLLTVLVEEVAAHGLVSLALGGVVVGDLAHVAEEAAALCDGDGRGDVTPGGPVIAELPLAEADRHVVVVEAVLVVTEPALVAAGPGVLLMLVLEVPALERGGQS